ncbi:protein of unknown function [Burkholderia multivorans]
MRSTTNAIWLDKRGTTTHALRESVASENYRPVRDRAHEGFVLGARENHGLEARVADMAGDDPEEPDLVQAGAAAISDGMVAHFVS